MIPHIYPATKTLEAIDAAIEADQGASFRGWLGKVLPHIGDAYRDTKEDFRTHLGASLIGRECAREIWYGFRWSRVARFGGRMMRLFNRGHLEEGRFIAALLTIGVQVFQQDENGKQYRISDVGGHFGGSGDGIALGIPDLPPGTWCLLEFKTHNDKSFKKLQEEGVRVAKPEHYVQMQVYMRKMGLACALYMACNKNDDSLYAEIIMLDSETGDQYIERAHKIIPLHRAPEPISKSPGWFKCRFCDMKGLCHGSEVPARNCRTCEFAVPDTSTGKWMCTNQERQMQLLFPATNPLNEDFSLTKERQLSACEHYQLNATFVK